MSKISAVVKGVAAYVPPDTLTNQDLEKMVDTNDEWITTRTGIKKRHILKGEGKGLSDMAIPAVEKLLEKTGTNPEDIDMIICSTITGDHIFPDTANYVALKVGAKNAFGYDLNAACSGFIYGLTTGCQFIMTGMYKKVIVIGGDVMSSIIDYSDRSTCIIFGDGCGAVLLEGEESEYGYQDAILRADGSGGQYLYMTAGGSKYPPTAETVAQKQHYVTQEGRPVFKAAVSQMSKVVEDLLVRNNMKVDDVNWLVPHQANKRIISTVSDYLGLSMERVMVNIQNYGNTTSGTIPLCLADFEKQLKQGDNVILTAFGGGFTWGAIWLKWAYNSQ